MMPSLRALFLSATVGLLLCSCGTLDTSTEPRGDLVMKGNVGFHHTPDAASRIKVTVRLLDVTRMENPIVIGEQTIDPAGPPPVPFAIEYRSDDLAYPKLGRLEARVSINGTLRYFSGNAYPVTNKSSEKTHELWLDTAR